MTLLEATVVVDIVVDIVVVVIVVVFVVNVIVVNDGVVALLVGGQ